MKHVLLLDYGFIMNNEKCNFSTRMLVTLLLWIQHAQQQQQQQKKMVIIIFQYIDSLGDGYQCVFIYIYSFMSDFRSLFSISDMDWLSWSERCPGNIMFAWLGFTHELPILYVVHRYWFDKTVWIPAPPLQNTMHFKMIIWPIYHFLAN